MASRPSEAPEGPRARKHAAEEAGGQPGARSHDPARDGLGTRLSPSRRRPAGVHVQHRLGASERRACRGRRQARTTHWPRPVVPDDTPRWVARLIAVATQYGRSGSRRLTGLLRGEGWTVHHKRIERLWRRAGLHVRRNSHHGAGCGVRMARAFVTVLSIGTTSGRMTSWPTARMTAGR